jgi:hypothetical protein
VFVLVWRSSRKEHGAIETPGELAQDLEPEGFGDTRRP